MYRRNLWILGALVVSVPCARAQSSGMSELEKQLLLGEPAPEAPRGISPSRDEDSPLENLEEIPEDQSKVSQDDLEELDEAIAGPTRIPVEQILVVQRRYIRKEGKHELTPVSLGVQPLNSFHTQVQWGFSYAYHLTESFGFEVLHGAFVSNFSSGLDETIKEVSGQNTKFADTPVVILGSSLLWTPFRSKAATRHSVYHFEGYLLGGGGMNFGESGNEGVAMGGLGFRAYLSQRGIFKTEVRDYIHFGDPLTHRVSFLIGAGILL